MIGELSTDLGNIDTMSFNAERPNNDLPSLPPPIDVDTRKILKACVEARAALAEVRIAGQLIPNQKYETLR